MAKRQAVICAIWILVALASAALHLGRPELFEPRVMREFFGRSEVWLLPLFLAACVGRILIFLPAMALLVAGLLLMPVAQLLVVTTIGFMISSSLLYFGARWLGLDEVFERHSPEKIAKIRAAVSKHGSLIVFFWAFFPAVPTDMISYVAGTVRMSFPRFLVSVTAGQSVLAFSTAFAGAEVIERIAGGG